MGLANIETVFERMAKALERLADAAESVGKRQPVAPAESPSHQQPAPVTVKAGFDSQPGAAVGGITYETINKAILGYSDKFGQAAAIELLKRFDAKIIKDLKAHPEKYAEILDATKAGP